MSVKERLSTFDVIDSRIILDPKSITAAQASKDEVTSGSKDLEEFPPLSLEAVSVPYVACDMQVYKRRWYMLVMYALLASTQACIWAQWGPIAATTEHAYGWTDSTIAQFINWGPITYIPTALLWSWLLDTKGLRVSCLAAAGLMTLGAGVRCIVKDPPIFTGLVHLGQALNGLAGPIAMGAVPKVSAMWFPPGERVTASTIMVIIVVIGVTASFFVGPQVVPEIDCGNTTELYNNTIAFPNSNHSSCDEDAVETQKENVMYYMYGTFGFCVLYLLVMLMYFPSAPPKPPSPSASTPRLNYLEGLKTLARNGRFWQIAIAYGISTGTRDSWGSLLDVNLKAHGISQIDASYLGIFASLGGIVSSLIVARVADYMKTRHKFFLVLSYGLTTVSQLWIVLLIVEILPKSIVSMYIAYGLMDLSNAAIVPLFYELVCETCYPVAEGIVNISLTTQNNIAALIFLGVQSVPDIGTVWMNWCLLSSFALAFLMLLFLPPEHHRVDIDMHTNVKEGPRELTDVANGNIKQDELKAHL